MLKSIQEISKATTIPETTIRRYFQVFSDALPEGKKLGRTKKYPSEIADTIKMIHASYQEGLSTVEIREKLSDTDKAELLEQTETITLPPEKTGSFQSDIRDLTEAVKGLTEAIKLSLISHNSTTELPQNNDTTMEPQENQGPDILKSGINSPETTTKSTHYQDNTTKLKFPENTPASKNTTTEPLENHDNITTEKPENQKPYLFNNEMDLSNTTAEPPKNHDNITTAPASEPVEDETTTKPEPEQVIEPQEPTQPLPAPETEDAVEEPASAQTNEVAQEPEPEEDADGIPDCHGKNLSPEERDAILIKVADLYPGRKNAQKRADVLNKAGLPCGKGNAPWNSKKFKDNLRYAKKRQGIK